MRSAQTLILSEDQIRQIVRRIAFEIYENNFDAKRLTLVGIYDKGYTLAGLILKELETVAEGIKTTLVRLDIDKDRPASSEIEIDVSSQELKGNVIILVDDVLNSGRTFAHSLKALLEVDVKKLETAVLVDRSHKRYPLLANYKGYELSTSIDEHVEVKLDKEVGVYLY